MPMYFPDLESVKRCATEMASQKDDAKKYKGIIPQTEEELPEARKQLGAYMRTVWNDTIFAMEIELAVTEEDYESKLSQGISKRMNIWH